MSDESVKRFLEKIKKGVAVELSVYEDRHGNWAKDVEFVERVRVKFSDQETLFLTYSEVKSLDNGQRLLIDHAPSSPPS